MSYDSTVLADNPIRYYKMQETSGTSAADAGSQAQNGTISGTVTLNQTKLAAGLGACMKFDGSTGGISLPTTSLPTGSSQCSIECWVQTLSLPASGFQTGIVMGNNSTDQWDGLLLKNSTAQASYGFFSDDLFAGSLSINTTYHLVGVWDGTKQQLYINGTNSNRTPGTPNFTQSFAYIGRDNASDWFNGYISNVAIYSSALSSTQVNNHYNAGIASSVALSGTLAGVGTLSGTLSFATALTATFAGVGTLSGTLPSTAPTTTVTAYGRDGKVAARGRDGIVQARGH